MLRLSLLILICILFVGMTIMYIKKHLRAETIISILCLILFSYYTWYSWNTRNSNNHTIVTTIDELMNDTDTMYMIHNEDTIVFYKK